MTEFYLKSIDRRWKKEVASAEESIIFLSPYLTSNTANLVLNDANPDITQVYTVFSFQNFSFGSSSIKTFKSLIKARIKLFHIAKLHAKILIVDGRFASIGSQNLTFGGTRNKEASIVLSDRDQVTTLYKLIGTWMAEAIPISEEMVLLAEDFIYPLQNKIQSTTNEVSEAEEEFWYQLELGKLQSRLTEVRQKLEGYFDNAGEVIIEKEVAQYLVRQSAWWLKHPAGYAVRAPRHASNIYGSNRDWRIDFGANSFLVGRAAVRCLRTVKDAIDRIDRGELISYKDIRSRMFHNIWGSVANFEGVEYEGFYSAIEGNDIVFGTQSVDVSDFIECIESLTGINSVFNV